jgi:hypothetical protein
MPEQTFDDLNLHDSRVLQVRLSLDLSDNESLEIFLKYLEDYDTLRTSLKRITFIDTSQPVASVALSGPTP